MIAIHPERVADDPQAVRWVVPAGSLPAGRVRAAPGRLGEMFAEGTLAAGLVEHTAVWLWLRDGESWAARGIDVRTALSEALADPEAWTIDPAPGEVLHRVTTDLLDGTVGDFIRSHGGSVAAERHDDTVAVRLGGACQHCAAADFTLRQRLLDGLRRRCPDLVEVGSSTDGLTLALGADPARSTSGPAAGSAGSTGWRTP